GGVDVQLEAIGTYSEAGGERLQGILGVRPGGPAVREQTGPGSLEIPRRRLRRATLAGATPTTATPTTADPPPAAPPAGAPPRLGPCRSGGAPGNRPDPRARLRTASGRGARRPLPLRSGGAGPWRGRWSRRSRSPDRARPWPLPRCPGRSRSGGHRW